LRRSNDGYLQKALVEQDEALAMASDPIYSPEALARIAAWEEENRAVDAWLERNRGAIPADYDELARLPSAYRIAALPMLSPEQASVLVQEHLRRSIAARPEMNDAQRSAVALAQQLFTPAWYAGPHETRVAAWQGELGQRLDEAFDLPERIRIFGSIGPEDEGLRAKIADAVAPPER
jgi:hypothetical protein